MTYNCGAGFTDDHVQLGCKKLSVASVGDEDTSTYHSSMVYFLKNMSKKDGKPRSKALAPRKSSCY